MAKPKFLYDNRLSDATPVASSTAAGDYNVLNLRDWRPYTWWKPSAMPATVRVDCGLQRSADYAILSGVFDAVQVVGSNNNWATEEMLASSNLLAASEAFGDVTWERINCTVASNVERAPDGTVTADRVDRTAAGNHYLQQTYTTANHAGRLFTFSVSLKAGSLNGTIALRISDGSATVIATSVVSLTSEWTRFSVSGRFGITPVANVVVFIDPSDDSGAAGDSFFVWGAQLVVGSKALPYQKAPDASSKLMLLPFEAPHMLSLPGEQGSCASTPDSAAISVTGDIDLRIKVALVDWTPPVVRYLISKAVTSGQYGYDWSMDTGGKLLFRNFPDGVNATSAISTVAVGAADGSAKWLRVTRNVTTGNVDFYTSDDGIAWSALGTTVATAAGGQFNGTDSLAIGAQHSGNAPLSGAIYYAELRNGIAGTVVASFDANDGAIGATSFASSVTGETWTVNGEAKIEAGSYRYYGLRCTDAAAPSLAIAAIGEALEAPVYFEGSFSPIDREVHGQTNRNEAGHALGRIVEFESWKSPILLKNVSWSWARDTFLPAWRAHLRGSPFGFCWDSELHPEDGRLVDGGNKLAIPHRAGALCDVQIDVEGVAP